jgi:hypothetical protein
MHSGFFLVLFYCCYYSNSIRSALNAYLIDEDIPREVRFLNQ